MPGPRLDAALSAKQLKVESLHAAEEGLCSAKTPYGRLLSSM